MCRSVAHGGRRCPSKGGGNTATTSGSTPATAPAQQHPEPGLPRLSKARFLATSVRDLAVVDETTGEITVSPKPAGMSEKAYRDHLESGPGITVRVRDADTEGLPERLWGGVRYRDLDPVSAKVVADSHRRKGQIVTATWSGKEASR